MVYSPKGLGRINIDWVEADEESSSGDTDRELQCSVTVFTVYAGRGYRPLNGNTRCKSVNLDPELAYSGSHRGTLQMLF